MQNNEFEKQVQERMGQIKFTPSAAVWAEVERNLKQRRKRRIAIVWLLVFFIAAGGSSLGWFYFSPGNTGIANHDSSSEKKNAAEIPSISKTPDQTITSSPDKKENPETDNIKEKSSTKKIADVETKETSQATTTTSGVSQKNIVSGSIVPKQKNKNLSSSSSLIIETSGSTVKKSKGKKSSADMLATVSPIVVTENGNKVKANGDEPNQGIAVKENASIPDSSVSQKDSVASLVKTATIDSLTTSASTVKINTRAKPKWQFGVTAAVGMSDIANPAFGAKSMDLASGASSNLSAPGFSAQSPGFQNPGLIIYPSELNAGMNFLVGAEATKKIKKRLSLNVGLQYHYYSTSIVVGGYLDSVSYMNNNSSYLAAGPRVTNYHNKYHLIELPVTIGFQLLKNKPLMLNTGFSLGQVFASDVLTYNSSQGIYSNDKNNLNKTQLNVLLSLSWTFAEKSRMPIQVGPGFSYGASNMSQKSVSGSNHMYTIGAGAKIMFHKK